MVVGQSSFNLYQKIKDLLRDTLMRIGDCRRMITNGAPLISPTSWCSLFSTTSSPSIQLMRSRTATHPHMCHPFSGPRKSAPISLHSAQYSRTKVKSIQISDSSVGVKDPFQLYIVVGYKILYEKTLVEKTNIMNCLRPLEPVKHTPISSKIPLSTAQ